jgi:hypothetical protein
MRSWLVFTLFFSLIGVVQADGRLPPNAMPGDLRGSEYPYVKIVDKVLKLAPGARIFDTSNRIILGGSLPQQAKIFYQLDLQGEVINLWLATPDEAASIRN